MTRSFALAASGLFCFQVAQAQYVTYRFTDGSLVSHAVTDVRSTDIEGADMRVFLWDGTTYIWNLSSLAKYQFTDISTDMPEGSFVLEPVKVFPNPSNGELRIGIVANGSGEVEVTIRDLRGGLVSTVSKGPLPAGRHELVWDGRDAQGMLVADGNYLVRVVQGPRSATLQVIVLH
ncbi:MAG: T9SS type A sorting domain-containing protein [Flavobacteriales bacterium]|nr:T9SS type A sorting domain-containing protein [Flavobacteriales bacterium]